MTFWIVTGLTALGASALFFLIILRARSSGEPAAAYDLRLYREQLREVDRDLGRKVINEGDADRIRTEISRRILQADAALKKHEAGSAQPRLLSWIAGLATAALLIGGTFVLYVQLGAPGYGDLGLKLRLELAQERAENRPSQAEMESQAVPYDLPTPQDGYAELVERLRETAKERPTDAQGQSLLARHEARLGNFVRAYQAKQKYIEIRTPDVAASDFADLAELMVLAAGGLVSPEAQQELGRALSLDPQNGPARYYWGLMMGQIGRPDVAFGIWRETLLAGPEDAPWIEGIRAQLPDMAYRAGQEVDPVLLQPRLPGPTADQMAEAENMEAEDRQAMIRGMVEGLSARLADQGGTATEWARLITALAVLGDVERANQIYAEAKTRFADVPAQAAEIEAAAQQAGLGAQ